MKTIIHAERKRILNTKTFLLFMTIILILSANSSYHAVKNYDIRDKAGVAVPWNENLAHGKEETKGKYLDETYLLSMNGREEPYAYMDEMNLEAIAAMNYNGKRIEDLSKKEINNIYQRRLTNIQTMLEESSRINYTEEEIRLFMEKAGQLISPLSMGYCEGWKVLNDDMGKFVPFLIILTALILLPLFGEEPQTKMKELYRSTKYGKKRLNRARIILAFPVGIILYIIGVVLYFIIKVAPFGLEGANHPIQTNAATFFSIYNITYLQQFMINVLIGLFTMIFMISFVLLITVLTEGIMSGAVILIFFWILLLTFDQAERYVINHYFANFMPLKMTDFQHYYIGNEIYRIAGNSISCLGWVAFVSITLSISIIILSTLLSDVRRSKGVGTLLKFAIKIKPQ